MFNLIGHTKLAPIIALISLSLINQTASFTSISADTLRAIHNNQIHKIGYHRLAKHQTHHYGASSSVGLIRLAKLEQRIYQAAQHLIFSDSSLQSSNLSKSVKAYIEDYVTTRAILPATQNATEEQVKAQVVAGNLIGAYRMVRRFRNYIEPWIVLSKQSTTSSLSQQEFNFLTTINSLKSDRKKQGPYRRDFYFTMIAIILTQNQLQWNTKDIARGLVKGMELGVTLQAVHCVEIGVHAVASSIFPIGIEWLELAVWKIKNGDHSVQLEHIVPLLENAKLEHDIKWKPMNGMDLEETFYERRLNETNDTKRLKWQRKTRPDPQKFSAENDLERSWDVCSGKLQKTDLEQSKLFCWQETKIHPTWKIGPLKVELHSMVPLQVLQFHRILGERIMDGIKSACEDKLYPAALLKTQGDLHPESCFTISHLPVHAQLLQLTQRITGMSAMTAEDIQPSAYAPGGHVRAHIDMIGSTNSFEERLATLTYYFDGPRIGGETAFPKANLAVKSIKGSAVFWFNRLKSSEVDEDSVHSSCPVVQGQKWIGTSWIRYHHQTHWVCDRDKNSREEYLVNGKSKRLLQET